jgi:hypothetical protein
MGVKTMTDTTLNRALLKKLLLLKKRTLRAAAKDIHVGYHSLVKTLTPPQYQKQDGHTYYREFRNVREAIAAWLGCPYDLIWGAGGHMYLRHLILDEIHRECKAWEQDRIVQLLGL